MEIMKGAARMALRLRRLNPVQSLRPSFFKSAASSPVSSAVTRDGRHPASIGHLFRGLLAAFVLVCVLSFVFAGSAGAQMMSILNEGLEYHKTGNLKKAVELYTEALQKKTPKAAEAHNWRGMAYEELGDQDKALADYNEAIRISPNYADAYNNRGELYRKQKKFSLAARDYNEAIKHDKNFPEAQFNAALVAEEQRNPKNAITHYEEYLKLSPNAADANQVKAKIEELKKAPPPPPKPAPGQVAQQPPGKPPVTKPPTPPTPPAPPKGAPAIPGLPPGVDITAPGGVSVPAWAQDWLPFALNIIATLGMLIALVPSLAVLFDLVMLFLIARKTRTSAAWLAFVPIANVILALNVARKPLWWLLLLIFLPVLIPVLLMASSTIASVDPTEGYLIGALILLVMLAWVLVGLLICTGIARARGKSAVWGVLTWIPCTNPIGMAYLGLSR
ncbi:MAG: tetratricopeptide repeat protein [Thermodesulfobacteriota bacterium]